MTTSGPSPSPVLRATRLSLTAEELQWALLNVTADEDRIAAIIGQRSTLTKTEIADMFRQQRRLTADEAVTAGLVHQIQELRIPAGNLIITVDPGD